MRTSREQKPYCFITFESVESASQASNRNIYLKYKDKNLRVEISKDNTTITAGPSLKGKYKVKVTGLPNSASWQVK